MIKKNKNTLLLLHYTGHRTLPRSAGEHNQNENEWKSIILPTTKFLQWSRQRVQVWPKPTRLGLHLFTPYTLYITHHLGTAQVKSQAWITFPSRPHPVSPPP